MLGPNGTIITHRQLLCLAWIEEKDEVLAYYKTDSIGTGSIGVECVYLKEAHVCWYPVPHTQHHNVSGHQLTGKEMFHSTVTQTETQIPDISSIFHRLVPGHLLNLPNICQLG
jgi:hypothetical protein